MSLTVQDGLSALAEHLDKAGIPGAGREARRLLAHLLGVAPDRMTLVARDPLSDDVLKLALSQASRRERGEPMSHILGYRSFWGRDFIVTGDVLDPRPETESLVAAALERPFAEVLDLGTGSGCILLTLLAERPEALGTGVDLSPDARAVAERNARALGVDGRCALTVSDWYSGVAGRFDLIVSNPPYIAAGEMDGLQRELAHEPRMALTDEGDGLSAYRAICAGAPDHLAPGGRLIVEIGPTQGAAVAEMFRAAGLEKVTIRPDLDGRDRVVTGEMPQ